MFDPDPEERPPSENGDPIILRETSGVNFARPAEFRESDLPRGMD
jgi:hypothetical protein